MMFISKSDFHRQPSKNGSVLLVTLLVVSLLLVLVLTFVTTVRMELRSVVVQQELMQARANARLGLALALARLQETAGPDQRATAAAGIGTFGDGDPSTPENGIHAAGDGTRHWTGVWGNAANPRNATVPGDDSKASHEPEVPVLLSWLVSGNEAPMSTASTQSNDFGRVTAHPDAATAGQLAGIAPWVSSPPASSGTLPFRPDHMMARHADGSLTLGDQPAVELVAARGDEARTVAAPLVEVLSPAGNTGTGHYAWWAGDEGVKARLDLQDLLAGSGGPEALHRPGAMNLSLLEADWEGDWPEMGKLSSTAQLAFAPGGDTLPDSGFHAYTLFSQGLPADSAKGGLRKDLTAGFDSSVPPAEIAVDEAFFTLPPDPAPQNHTVPDRNNLTRTQWSGDAPASGTLPSWGGLRGYVRLKDGISGETPLVAPRVGTSDLAGIFPIATRVHYHVHGAVVNGRAYLLHLPTVVFWNPYNVRMAPAEFWFNVELNYHGDPPAAYQSEFGRAFPAVLVAHGPVAFGENPNTLWGDEDYRRDEMVAGRGASGLINGSERIDSAPDQGFRFLVRMTEPLEPGEARVFSPLEPEELHSDPAQRVLIDGFGENTWFHEEIPLDRSIGGNHVFRMFISWPMGLMNRPSRYAYGLGTDFSESTQLRRVDGITGPGYHNPGSVTTILKIQSPGQGNVDPFHATSNPLITGAPDFPQPDNGRASAREISNWLTTLNPDLPGGQFPPAFSPFGWDYKIQMALPTEEGEPAGSPHVHIRWLGQHNPLSEAMGASLTDAQGTRGYNNHPLFPMNLVGTGSARKRVFDVSPDFPDSEGATFVGGSHFLTLPMSSGRLVVRDLPRLETGVLSLGALSHANVHPRRGQISSHRAYTAAAMPAFPIGNALADPRVHPGDIDGFPDNWNSTMGHGPYSYNTPRSDAVNRRLHFDLSYLLNRALFDRYFFSGVPGSGSLDGPFDNPLIRPATAGIDPSELRDFDRAAAHLRLYGAFNVNSVSVEAWTALLTSFRGQSVPGAGEVSDLTPYPKALFPLSDPLENEGGNNLTYVADRFRRLSDDEILALAESIVSEIRARGPALSLAGFINRRPHALASASPAAAATLGRTHGDINSSNPLERRVGHQALLGTLQHAIDRIQTPSVTQPGTVTGINDRLRTWLDTQDGTTHGNNTALLNQPWLHRPAAIGFEESMNPGEPSLVMPDMPLALRSPAVGMPGYLTQADLLRALAPVLSARSDTFRVRFYGDHAGSRAWGEAVVQRQSAYLDAGVDPVLHPRLTPPASQRFGRRFEVVSFTWLNPEEL
ncbi:MAG: hypothetical protein JJU05_09385 [Verrucomicrobia bacterium]|nr:hypothetical protein [Verrucomicrobiota bacterium]MCH8526036.1 hypothetical protein [Kiritimatiellia bacterium]